MWQVESSGPHTILVVRRKRGIQQDLARDANGRIIWFESREEAQAHADRLNAEENALNLLKEDIQKALTEAITSSGNPEIDPLSPMMGPVGDAIKTYFTFFMPLPEPPK